MSEERAMGLSRAVAAADSRGWQEVEFEFDLGILWLKRQKTFTPLGITWIQVTISLIS